MESILFIYLFIYLFIANAKCFLRLLYFARNDNSPSRPKEKNRHIASYEISKIWKKIGGSELCQLKAYTRRTSRQRRGRHEMFFLNISQTVRDSKLKI